MQLERFNRTPLGWHPVPGDPTAANSGSHPTRGRRPSTPGPIRPFRRIVSIAALSVLAAGCMHVKTEPIEVKPIHITVDVNVRVERALEDFFGDLDRKSSTIEAPNP